MKKIFLLSLFSFSLQFVSFVPVFSQNTKDISGEQSIQPYLCEEDWIEVMFTGESKVRMRNGNLVDLATQALQGTDQVLNKMEWHQWQRFSDVPESKIDEWEINGERNTGQDVYNLNNIYRLQIPKGKDVWKICSELQALPGIELVMPVPKPMAPPIPPNYQSQQGYLNPATNNPSGVDALWSWTQTGGTGSGVTVCDLEYSWNYNHADITKGIGSSLNSWTDPGWGTDHGTAVIGELVADNNGWGTTGVCYGAGLKTCGTNYGSPASWNVAGAIAIAIANLNAGDIILLEQQWDYTGSGGYVPIEWYNSTNSPQTNNSVYAAIVNAVTNGIHVVEAGGNGNINMDNLIWYGNSGAIIVGAGGAYSGGTYTEGNLQRLSFSSYGQRFDLQGWGENVVTTGYNDLYSSEGANYYYTSSFSGTSSASPIVAGALACAEGYYLANISSTPPTPAYMRTHLITYGTAQITPPSGNIGPRPNIKAAIQNFPPPQTYYDWGDAPPPFATLASVNGAYHPIGLVYLGNAVDPENDGQPDMNALGDDNNGTDDEDGVVFTSLLTPGQNAFVTITASVQGYLYGWMDFNNDGDWNDYPDEFIFPGTYLNPGPNSFSFFVPAYAVPGITYSRFRFTNILGSIVFYGVGPEGEVEDYQVYIEESEGLDWGDAPDGPYPTLSASMGANHMIIPGMYLGNSVDGEQDGQPDPLALGDDQDIMYPPPNDDEDGVTFKTALIPGQSAIIDVVASQSGFLSAWIDFNQINSWNDAGEQVLIDFLLNPGLNTITFLVPAGVQIGNTFARFRYSMVMGLGFFGSAPDGEVEDYAVNITQGASGYQIDPDPGQLWVQNEISMVLLQGVQPGVPAVLLAAYNDHPYPGGPGLGVSYSNDGGTSWNPSQLPYPPDPYGGGNFLDAFDPTATADALGNLYVAHISTDYNWSTGPASGLFVHKSTDGGVTWNAPVAVATDAAPIGSPDPNYRFNDRCQMTADVGQASPYLNNIYIVEIKDRGWNNPLLQSDIYFSSSNDGGLTWSPQVILNGSQSSMANMPVPAVAPDGTIYVSWLDYNVQTGGTGTIYLDVSTDGGVTWLTNDLTVMTIPLPPLNLNSGTDVLAKGAPVIHTSPFNSQELYIVFAAIALGGDEGNIIFIKSTDGGVTWTSGIMVNDDGTSNDQVLPWMDVKPNGIIDIAWYDRRNDPADLNWEVYMATSTDGGNSFNANQLVSSFNAPSPSTISGLWMGEYLGLVVDQTYAYMAFTLANPDTQGDIYFNKLVNPGLQEIDFGDANDPTYPTLLANDGARHILNGITFLGVTVDPESDGQPNPNATGDDNNGLDDEDGVVFSSPLLAGSPAMISVTVSGGGLLNLWIDYDGDGTWAQANEHVFTDFGLIAGTHNLNFIVPANATAGISFARFRISNQPALSYTGHASDGEVEDYEVPIEVNPDYKWQQLPNPNLSGLHAHDAIVPPYESIVIADDWLCSGGQVTDIHWWGNYENIGAGINYFHLSIHNDDPSGTCLPLDPEVWGINVPFNNITEQFTGMYSADGKPIYLYEYMLPVPFDQVEGNRYWLDISAFSNDPNNNNQAIWRWQEAQRSYYPILCGAANKVDPGILPWSTIQWNSSPPYMYSDMAFVITSEEIVEELDFGDASDPLYPTLLANDGARHILDGVTFLGALVDPEPNGQPDPNAMGDDNNGSDDEDGVTFGQILTGSPAQITVTTSIAGYLQGWIDYNGDGDWADLGEQIFTDEYIQFGYTVCINYLVPGNALIGTTYARFRFSNVSGLSYTGSAPNGEVEDYQVQIFQNPDIKWIQEPCAQLPGLHAHDAIVPPYESIVLADDWLCSGGQVTDIHWWGNYENVGTGINYFHLSIHNNDPMGTCLPLDPEIWGANVPFSSISEQYTGMNSPDGKPIYLYEYVLPVPFDQVAGNRYWLDISAFSNDPNNPVIWRWQEAQRTYYPILCGAANKVDFGILPWSTIQWNSNPPYMYSDMAFAITSVEIPLLDLGDLPDGPYPTLLSSNGPSHLVGSLFMGNQIDPEFDGQPQPNALGDDFAGIDDEDGVALIGGIFPGQISYISVNVSQGNGYLQGWIDYNADGDFVDIGEQIFTDLALPVGSNMLTFTPDPNATIGTTFARFRISTLMGLGYAGPAPDGEVEDYEVIIRHPIGIWHLDENSGNIAFDATSYSNDGTVNGATWTSGFSNSALNFNGSSDEVTVLHSPSLDITGQFSIQAWIKSTGTQLYYAIVDKYEYNPAGSKGFTLYINSGKLRFSIYSGAAGTADLFGTSELRDNTFHHVMASWDGSFMSVYVDGYLEGQVPWTNPPASTTQSIGIGMRLSGWGGTMPFSGIIDEVMISSDPPAPMDFGDAPDPNYPTLFINDGARHILDGITYLGFGVDPDLNGQPDPAAMGDDNNGMDDEDGVALNMLSPPWMPGGGVFIDIQASVNGILNAWVDYDANGYWGDPGEQIFVDQPLTNGTNSFIIGVPANAQVGKTFARYRFSSVPGLYFTGSAPDGEVEDYEVTIEGEVDVDLRVFLEGPYVGPNMATTLNTLGYLPLGQPYNADPLAVWYYNGTESVPAIPNANITDWVLVEFRDAPSAAAATRATMISMQPAFVMNNGMVIGLDGVSPLKVNGVFQYNPYVVIWHRNHLGVLSASPLTLSGINYYTYDFTTGAGQAYLNGHKDLGSGIYGMFGGDGKPDEFIDNLDKVNVWSVQAGTGGYKEGDFNMNGQVNNPDKNSIWVPNLGTGTKVP